MVNSYSGNYGLVLCLYIIYVISVYFFVLFKYCFSSLFIRWFFMKIVNESLVVYFLKEVIYNLVGEYYVD